VSAPNGKKPTIGIAQVAFDAVLHVEAARVVSGGRRDPVARGFDREYQ
jgi:hypothetical protein